MNSSKRAGITAATAEKTRASAPNPSSDRFPKPKVLDYLLLSEILWGTSNTLTPMDLLSTEGLTADRIETIVRRYLGDQLDRRFSEAKAVDKINEVYQASVEHLSYLGFHGRDSQKNRKFASIAEFVAFLDSIKPEFAKSPRELVVDCVLARTMTCVVDVLGNERVAELDREAEAVLDKIRKIPGVSVRDEHENGFTMTFSPLSVFDEDLKFRGKLKFRSKHLRKVFLKLNYNRKYHKVDLMKDLLALRFECEEGSKSGGKNLENAVSFFARKVFNDPELGVKGGALSDEFVSTLGARHEPVMPKAGTSKKLKTADLTGTIKAQARNNRRFETGLVEMQFQAIGSMESGMNQSEIYDLTKFLSANARNLPGLSLANVKFLVKLVTEEIDVSERAILSYLFHPQTWVQEEDDEKVRESDKYPYPEHGFLLPLVNDGKHLRFSTRDVWTPDFNHLYKNYPKPQKMSFDVFLKLYDKVNVDDLVRKFRSEDWRL